MADLFGPNATTIWVLVLAAALFFPVRHLIWVLTVRREEKRQGPTDETRRAALKRRATFTAVLLCLVFSYIYAVTLTPGR